MELELTGKLKRFGAGKKGNYAKIEVKRSDGQDDDLVVTAIPDLTGFSYGKLLTVKIDAFVNFGKCVKVVSLK